MDKKQISDKIDELISDLKKSLMNAPYNQRTFFDKVKNWWQNLRKGPTSPSNPYRFQNQFGSLGSHNSNTDAPAGLRPKTLFDEDPETTKKDGEEFELGYSKNESRLSLSEYAFLNENVYFLSEKISSISINEEYSSNIKNLEIFKIIDAWGVKFKNEIYKMIFGEKTSSQSEKANPVFDQPSAAKKQNQSSIEFKSWIKNEDNMENFVNIINRVYGSPQYSQPLSVVSNTLESKGIVHSGKTGLSVAIRNKILAILKREIDQNSEENSVFVKNVWHKHKKAALKKLEKNQEDEGGENKDEEAEIPASSGRDFPRVDPQVSVDDLNF
jgi:hypothetical protein